MNARHEAPSGADLAAEASGLAVGLGIITMTLSPLALPGLLLALPLVLPLVPLVLAGGAVYLLARALLLPVRLARRAWRARSARSERPPNQGTPRQPGSAHTPVLG
jgi:hypothetical protein